ncbi:MAG TPA: HAD family hydrolase [Acidobacteriota bacterium]|nr:HAD family hydrolase [Acidobacteriota bacterium]
MRLILFDIDGTLMTTDGAGTRALNRALQEVFGLTEAMRDIRPDGKTDSQIVREALSRNGGLDMPQAEALRSFFRVYLRHFDDELVGHCGLTVFWQAYHLILRLRDGGRVRTGIATGNIRPCAELKLRSAGLHSFFPFGGFGCDAEDRHQMVRAAVRRGEELYGIRAQSVIVIGDTPNDIEHGRKAGARTIAVATGNYSRVELQETGADLAVDSLQPTPDLLSFIEAA